MSEKRVIHATRESLCNGDDEQKCRELTYEEGEMLSHFLKAKVSEYLPYTTGLTIWIVYMDSDEDQPTDERENPEKKTAFIHKNENRCIKCEIRGGDRLVSDYECDKLYCAVYHTKK